MPRKFKGEIPDQTPCKLFKITAGTHYEVIKSVLYIHFQDYTLRTIYYIIQTNKGTSDVNRFITILTALSRILSIRHEAYELLHQLPSPVRKKYQFIKHNYYLNNLHFSIAMFLKQSTFSSRKKKSVYNPLIIINLNEFK